MQNKRSCLLLNLVLLSLGYLVSWSIKVCVSALRLSSSSERWHAILGIHETTIRRLLLHTHNRGCYRLRTIEESVSVSRLRCLGLVLRVHKLRIRARHAKVGGWHQWLWRSRTISILLSSVSRLRLLSIICLLIILFLLVIKLKSNFWGRTVVLLISIVNLFPRTSIASLLFQSTSWRIVLLLTFRREIISRGTLAPWRSRSLRWRLSRGLPNSNLHLYFLYSFSTII